MVPKVQSLGYSISVSLGLVVKFPRSHKASELCMWGKAVGPPSPSRKQPIPHSACLDPLHTCLVSPEISIFHSDGHTITLSTYSLQNDHTLALKDCLLNVAAQLWSDWHLVCAY